MSVYKLLINGQFVEGEKELDIINPATEEIFTTVARASEAQMEEAVAAARKAFLTWSVTSIEERQSKLIALSDAIRENSDELSRLLTCEQGKPLFEARMEVAWTEGFLRYYATLAPSRRIIQDDEKFRIEARREPLGVISGIVPWNFPLLIAAWKFGPAILTGNTIIVKPSPTTPVTTLKHGEFFQKIFPPGVINIIVDDNDLGPLLISHPDIAKVSFTGSTITGLKIAAGGAKTLKRMTLELGGNDPAIVLNDVDVKKTALAIYGGAFLNAGQVCIAIKRAYIHEDIYEEICSELVILAKKAIVGDGISPDTTQGPLQNKRQYEKICVLLGELQSKATIIAGGTIPDKKGYFIPPTIVRDARDGDQIVEEEQFGPILPLIKYSDVQQVIETINTSEYGLGASVWSADVAKATQIAGQIESGTVWVNQHGNIGPNIPMAGYKKSGLGIEQSQEGIDEFTQMKVLHIAK